MKTTVFVICSVVPYRKDGVEGVSAVHVVVREIIGALKNHGYRICIQMMAEEGTRALTASELAEIAHLKESGFEVLPPLFIRTPVKPVTSLGGRIKKLLDECIGTRVDVYYPSSAFRQETLSRVAQTQSDVVLTLWSPEGVAATSGGPAPQIAYQGDVEFAPWKARIDTPTLYPFRSRWPDFIIRPLARLRCAALKRAHLSLMKKVRVIANVTDCNARYYTDEGHPRSVYTRNTWTDDGLAANGGEIPQGPPYKIIGHLGYLDRTGSTFGLHYLLKDLMPALDEEMKGLDYSVHIIGGGEMAEPLRAYLKHPRLVLRGFVKDLNSELLSSHAVLLLNNVGAYKAAYTRHLVAWSMRLCLIAHSNSKDAIPEMVSTENCLMADSPKDLAHLIRRSLTEPAFSRQIRQKGRETYEKFFKPEQIAASLAKEIEGIVANKHKETGV